MGRVVDVTLALASGPGEATMVLVKLQAPTWELNFRATADDLARLSQVRDTDWAARRCLHIGESAGSPVHWATDGQTTTIMVGQDDETWDIAVAVPTAAVDRIVADAAAGRW
ncbi:hypothetical protein GCM10029964_037540 [Kibdelosporangium lantanae]